MQFHDESPDLSAAGASRLQFLAAMRRHLHSRLGAGNRHLYSLRHARPGDESARGEAAAARRAEIRAGLEQEPYFQAWSSALRASQDLMWEFIGGEVDRDMPRLRERFAARSATARGSVRTDAGTRVPGYLAAEDTHRMPGSYFAEGGEGDLRAGALYDIGGAIYQLGIGNSSGRLLNDSRGRTLVSHLKRYYPDFAPRRILDAGCGVGHNTVPLAEAFPDSEVYGCDVGAAMVRFAHLRAEGLGQRVHFVQADAEATGLEAGSFDLVVTQIVLHETSPEGQANVVRESFRLLRPGGVAIHLEVPIRYAEIDAFSQFFLSWEQYYNSESNIEGAADADLGALMRDAGFADVLHGYQPIPPAGRSDPQEMEGRPTRMGTTWLVASGRKPRE